ncbi:MAG: hypothetical protein LJE59_05405 [Chromatiaceae bacterium]|nr:hypothetical protein [Chromatiaceae bacterium]
MRLLIKLLSLLLLVTSFMLLAAAWVALSDNALVTQRTSLSPGDIARAKAILKQNDPRNMARGAFHVIEIGAQDLNLGANYLVQKFADGHAQLAIVGDHVDVAFTFRIAHLPWRNHLNLHGTIESVHGQPQLGLWHIGRLPIPGKVASWIAHRILAANHSGTLLGSAANPVKGLKVFPDRVRLIYQWDPALIEQARTTLLTGSDREALYFYHESLIDLQAKGVGISGSLVDLLEPLFAMAMARSGERDPVEENIALLSVLGAWASRQDLARLVPESSRRPQGFRLKIEGRRDFAQHFLASAALAARGDSALSDAVGLFKELSDTQRGSGFSFTDIAADRAGTRFGALAARSEQDARRVQQRLAASVAETDLMPPAKDLPEHLNSTSFKALYDHVGSPAYQRVMDEIERRIDACSLYRG